MKRYWPIVGAVGVAATLGLYAYMNHSPTQKNDRSQLEDIVENREGTSPSEEPNQSTEPKTYPESNQRRNKHYSEKKTEKQHQAATPKLKPKREFPKIPNYPKDENEEEEERASYDLPKEKREALTTTTNSIENFGSNMDELFKHFEASLDAYDFKVAASYIDDLQCNPCITDITTKYNAYLSDVIENCHRHDFNSVFRKIMWMNLFLAEKQDILTKVSQNEGFNLALFIKKGNQALETIEYCR